MPKQVWKATYQQWFKDQRGGPLDFTDTFMSGDSVDKACETLTNHAKNETLEKRNCVKVKILSIEMVGDPLTW